MSIKIRPVLCHAGYMDNYAYLVTDEQTGKTAIIDAAEAERIFCVCRQENLTPEYIFVTHHHEDHTNGNEVCKEKFGVRVFGSEIERNRISGLDMPVKDGDEFYMGQSRVKVILTPGHTNGHILWYFPDDKALFTGDMLFNLCIGGMFEGTPEEMWQSIEKIKALPDDVRFYPGHEYTNAGVGILYEHKDEPACREYIDFIESKKRAGLPIVGNTLGLEKKCNPYFLFKSQDDFVAYFEG
jgi:hydroxyacylglutathione hydrolase